MMDRDRKKSVFKSRSMAPRSQNKRQHNSIDFIKLGQKSVQQGSKNLAAASHDRKPTEYPGLVKKARMSPPAPPTTGTSQLSRVFKRDSTVTRSNNWESDIVTVTSESFLTSFTTYERLNDVEHMQGTLCGAVKLLVIQQPESDTLLCLSLMFLAKTRPYVFRSEVVIEALCHLLKQGTSASGLNTLRGKRANAAPILAANLLLAVFRKTRDWPEIFVQVCVADFLGASHWVDHEECRCFVENIMTAFPARLPPHKTIATDLAVRSGAHSSTLPVARIDEYDDDPSSSLELDIEEVLSTPTVMPRYRSRPKRFGRFITKALREYFEQSELADSSRNVLELICRACGVSGVRSLVAHRLETWMTNPKLMRPVQDIFLAICMNYEEHTDLDIYDDLVRIRLETRPAISHFRQCMRELLGRHPDNLETMMRRTISNELSRFRNPNNLELITVMLQHSSDRAAHNLAKIFLEIIKKRDDDLRALRALLREIVRVAWHELDFREFCYRLLHTHNDLEVRHTNQIADLITSACFTAVAPILKECGTARYRNEGRAFEPLTRFRLRLPEAQRVLANWLHLHGTRMYRSSRGEFKKLLRKLLFLCNKSEHSILFVDNWPPEQERHLYLRLVSEVPVMEETLFSVLFIALNEYKLLSASEALDYVDQLTRRAAKLHRAGDPAVLRVQRSQIFDIMFSVCTYLQRQVYPLDGYVPPTLAIADLYWRATLTMMIIIAHNPSTCGPTAWNKFPILQTMIYMCITKNFLFPTAVTAEQEEEMRTTEAQIALREKHSILEFERYLAVQSKPETVATITEQNSELLPKLMLMDPSGPARRPPQAVLNQLKVLNDDFHIRHLLCRSRRPDFLLEIIQDQQQNPSQSMPWLSDLVENVEDSLENLPIQCLCEFVLTDVSELSDGAKPRLMQSSKWRRQQQVMDHLQHILRDASTDQSTAVPVIECFMKGLTSQNSNARWSAARSLRRLLCPQKPSENGSGLLDWLLEELPQSPHFVHFRDSVVLALGEALRVETEPVGVAAYVHFLALYTPDLQLADVCLELARLMLERPITLGAILNTQGAPLTYGENFLHSVYDLFQRYLVLAQTSYIEWTNEVIQIRWFGAAAPARVHSLVFYAIVMTLTYGAPSYNRSRFDKLLKDWFPTGGERVHIDDAPLEGEVHLFPDWLRLLMIKSEVTQLVDAALEDARQDQLVLFIQTFGMPIPSVNKVLELLDAAVEIAPQSARNARSAVSAPHLYQLIEVLQRRGASGGTQYKRVLALEMETPMGVKEQRVVEVTPRRVVKTAKPEAEFQSVGDAIWRIFNLGTKRPPIIADEERDLRRKLQKLFAQDIRRSISPGNAVGEFIMCCSDILQYPATAELFVTRLHSKAAISCPLFKLVITACRKQSTTSPLVREFASLCEKIVSVMHVPKGSKALTQLLEQFLNKRTSSEKRITAVKETAHRYSVVSLTQVATLPQDQFEKAFCSLVNEAISSGDTADLSRVLAKILSDETLKQSSEMKTAFSVLDWLGRLEPECMRIDKRVQLELLFKKTNNRNSLISRLRPYLLSTLVHRAHWTTLLSCIKQLLSRPFTSCYDASAVLDFLSSCMFIPKIWRGRARKLPKHHSMENVLTLSSDEILSVADHVLDEIVSVNEDERAKAIATSRIHIIEHSCVEKAHITRLVEHLARRVDEDVSRRKAGLPLLVELYSRLPWIIFLAGPVHNALLDIGPLKNGHTRVDSLSHSILVSLSVCETNMGLRTSMKFLNLSCRKLAATHPALFLRQLPLIDTLLRSRMSAGIPMFGKKGHRITFFRCMMGVMEVLGVKLHHTQYVPVVSSIFGTYLESLLLHVNAEISRAIRSNIGSHLDRLLGLINSFIRHNLVAARAFLAEHRDELEKLSSIYAEKKLLRSFIQNGDAVISTLFDKPGDADVQEISRNLSDRGETVNVLRKLENAALQKPGILKSHQAELRTLLSSGDEPSCVRSLRLISRHIEWNPDSAYSSVPCYLQCLMDDRYFKVLIALDRLPNFVVLCEEHAPLLLRKAFQQALCSSFNNLEPILDALKVLQLQYGN